MPRFLLEHRHTAAECGTVFAAFNAFDSPLRRASTTGSCFYGDHRIWWEVDAATAEEALARLLVASFPGQDRAEQDAPVAALAGDGKKHFNQGMKHEQAEEWDKAVEEFAKAVNESPKNPEYRLHLHVRTSNVACEVRVRTVRVPSEAATCARV